MHFPLELSGLKISFGRSAYVRLEYAITRKVWLAGNWIWLQTGVVYCKIALPLYVADLRMFSATATAALESGA